MIRIAVLVAIGCALCACSPASDTTGSISSCAREMYPAFNAKIMEQCVAACKKCDHGVTTTCTTSCTLKGAR
jgi:hypothetical protein